MDTIRLHLDDMAYGGAAVGRYEGKAVFVPGGIPGEDVLAEIVEEKRRYARARLVEIVNPSPERVAPLCEVFGHCGGCQWQHIAYDAQLRYKERIVRSQLERKGGIDNPPVRPPIGMRDPWAYRNNMQFVVDDEGHLCLLALGGREAVPVGECRLMCAELSEIADDLELEFPGLERVTLRAGRRTGEQMLVLEMAGEEMPELAADRPLSCVLLLPDGTGVALMGRSYYHEEMGGRRLRVSAGSFFQVNTEQAEHLVRLVKEYASVQPGQTVLDAYGGVGALGLALAAEAGQVLIVEASPSAAADARRNAEGAPNVIVIEGAVEDVLPDLAQPVDVAVLDPPRAGVARRALDALTRLRPQRVVYVSCDPGSLAGDVRHLVDRGYRLEVLQPVDLFPQTHHIETVSLLTQPREGEAPAEPIPDAPGTERDGRMLMTPPLGGAVLPRRPQGSSGRASPCEAGPYLAPRTPDWRRHSLRPKDPALLAHELKEVDARELHRRADVGDVGPVHIGGGCLARDHCTSVSMLYFTPRLRTPQCGPAPPLRPCPYA